MASLRTHWIKSTFDKPLFWIVVVLVIAGFFIFISASLSVLAESSTQFYRMLASQIALGLFGGILAGYIVFRIPLVYWQRYSFVLWIITVIVTALVFVPGIGASHGGATRWIDLGFLSFQPAEFLKITTVLAYSAWFSRFSDKVGTFLYGLLPWIIGTGIIGGVLLAQPDTDGFLVIMGASFIIYYIAGAKWRHMAVILLVGIIGAGALIATRPYLLDRMKTFIDPSRDPRGSSYQVRQALIAVGSGGLIGRGYGHSVQKFHYLPEPTSDSIFAVFSEEVGFVGACLLICAYVFFTLRGFFIAKRSSTGFGRLLVIGIVSFIIIQSFMNIAANIGLFPLSGLSLIFISQGGTALMTALVAVAFILHVSRNSTKSRV